MVMLNTYLVNQQKLSQNEISRLQKLHLYRERLFRFAKILNPISDANHKTILRRLVRILESVEFDMQRTWRFEVTSDKHTWWHHIPHCSCTKVNNEYFNSHILSQKCVAHGS